MTDLSTTSVEDLLRLRPPSALLARTAQPSAPVLVRRPVVPTRDTGPGRWRRPLLDTATAAVVGATVLIAGAGHVALVVAAGLAWPLLLLSVGAYARRPLDEAPVARAGRTVRGGARLGLACWLGSPLLAVEASTTVTGVVALTTLTVLTDALPAHRTASARVVLAGSPRAVRRAWAELDGGGRHHVVGACLTSRGHVDLPGIPVHHGLDRAADVSRDLGADALLVVAGQALRPRELRRLQWEAAGAGVHLYVGTGLLDVEPSRTRVVSGGGLGIVHVDHAVLDGPRRLVKDVVERTLAAVMLLVLLPVMLVVAAVVSVDSPGSPLFRQLRIGRHGEAFTMLKFRTMTSAAEAERRDLVAHNEASGVLFKIRQDPRVTRVGAILRRYSIDELPQLWNVVAGDMSLVGPRPALPQEVARYGVDPRRRLVVKPGITGLWQVSGRSDLSWRESVRLDLRYVDNWSLRLDAWILLRTVRAVLSHRGAY